MLARSKEVILALDSQHGIYRERNSADAVRDRKARFGVMNGRPLCELTGAGSGRTLVIEAVRNRLRSGPGKFVIGCFLRADEKCHFCTSRDPEPPKLRRFALKFAAWVDLLARCLGSRQLHPRRGAPSHLRRLGGRERP